MRALRALLLLLFINCAHAEEYDARIIAVMDGDTVLALKGGQKIKVRLANIDAPEKDQAYGMASRQAMVDRTLKKWVHVKTQAIDKYGRTVAELSIDGHSINEEQVQNGMAWEYSHYHSNKTYIALEAEARSAHRGLWADANPTPPWEWRKAHPWAPQPGFGLLHHFRKKHAHPRHRKRRRHYW
jgi:endonuclease YncB( thermonuclease family)